MQDYFRKEVYEYQKKASQGSVILYPRISYTIISTGFLAFFFIALLVALNSNYTKKETVRGWVESGAGGVKVYGNSTKGEVINEVLVVEGQYVDKGQVLVIVRDISAQEDGDDYNNLISKRLLARRLQLEDQISAAIQVFDSKIKNAEESMRLEQSRKLMLEQRLKISEERVQLLSNTIARSEVLLQKNHISLAHHENLLEEQLERKDRHGLAYLELVQQRLRIEELMSAVEFMKLERQMDIARLQDQSLMLEMEIDRSRIDWHRSITSPVAGYVSNLQIVEGSTVEQSKPILSILPNKDISAVSLIVPARSAGFIRTGQLLNIRIDAFPYEKYGFYEGKVEQVSENIYLPDEFIGIPISIGEPFYLINAIMLPSEGLIADMQLKTGMTLEADIKIESKTVFEWIISPLNRVIKKI